MRQRVLAIAAGLVVLMMSAGSAQGLGFYDFEWTGFGGYSVVGTFGYLSPGLIIGLGSGPTTCNGSGKWRTK